MSSRKWMLSAALLCAALPMAQGQQPAVTSVSWLAGCWRTENKATIVDEQWMAPRGGVMLGMGRTTRADSVIDYEFVRIYRSGNALVYAAHPSGQAPAEFRSQGPAGDEVRFENPDHDFPQRVAYRRIGVDSLLAYIEGRLGGQLRRQSFGYRRVPCH